MRKAREKPVKDQVDFSYEGSPLPPNLLDYRYMQISMTRWADTGRISCLGTIMLALGLFSLCGLMVLGYWLLISVR